MAARHEVLRAGSAPERAAASARVRDLVHSIRGNGCACIAPAIAAIKIGHGNLHIRLDRTALAGLLDLRGAALAPALLDIQAPFGIRRRGAETKIVAGTRQPSPDRTLLRALRHAHRGAEMLKGGTPLWDIARTEARSESYVARLLPLATLLPRLQQAIVAGTQPTELTLESLVRNRLPLDWSDQERRLGITA
jgi:hypothetical protein